MLYVFIAVALALTILMSKQESKRRKISFTHALLLCIFLTPLFGYFIVSSKPLRNARGCNWCGNDENEAVFCGLCGKNEEGLMRGEITG